MEVCELCDAEEELFEWNTVPGLTMFHKLMICEKCTERLKEEKKAFVDLASIKQICYLKKLLMKAGWSLVRIDNRWKEL